MPRKRTKLFTVTAEDCRWDVFRGSGNGGQKKQKTSSGVRCVHIASGAEGKATDHRDQKVNRGTAFKRMSESKEFKAWIDMKVDALDEKLDITEMNEVGQIITRKLRMDEV